jgi:heme A synthase
MTIEASHRVTSGIAAVLVLVLLVCTLRALPRGHRARRGAAFSAVFILGEVAIGAGLVLFELVAHDASMRRALSIVLHLGNTFLLLGALALTAESLTDDRAQAAAPSPSRGARRILTAASALAVLAFLVLGASGAIAALGDTLFPARSLREGLVQDISPATHAFLRLRVLHPFFALGTGLVVFATASVARVLSPAPRVTIRARAVTLLFATQFAAGLLNVTLLAPVWMQVIHLLLADLTWIVLVSMIREALRPAAQAPIMSRNGPAPTSDVPPSTSNVDPVTYAPAGDTR